jgi:hypothetical protein
MKPALHTGMTKQILCVSTAVLMLCACGGPAQTAPGVESVDQQSAKADKPTPSSNVNPDAKLLADFNARVKEYEDLRDDLKKKAPPLKKTNNPDEITVAEKALAQQIRMARANAKHGDIFTPATQAMFRRLLNPTMKGGEGAENKEAIKEDAPKPAQVPFKVNAEYPKEVSLSTMPPDVLKALPQLPEGLEYRFVGKHLLLYCSRANLIVDYMPNAIS